MAELSQYLGFLIILKESFKLIIKNVKLMAAITLLSLLLPSLLLLVFFYIYQTLTNFLESRDFDSSYFPPIACILLLLLSEITAIIAFAKISYTSGIATVLVSAASYTDTEMSSHDLYSRIKTTTRRSKFFAYRSSSNRGIGILATLIWMAVILMAIFHPNPITITIAVVVGVSVYAFQLYASVAAFLSMVVSVVEEKYEGSEALEKAEELIEGQRCHGFMVNLFTNLLVYIVFMGFWLVLGGRLWSLEFWLVLVNVFSLARMYACVANTVLYFRCKEYHGADEEVGGLGQFGYSKLPNSNLDPAN